VEAPAKKVAVVQSNYIPWRGYFDLIAAVDEFILFDDMQYTRRDWRNRNKVKTPAGVQWLTVPVRVKGRFYQSIRETEIDGTRWAQRHWDTLCHHYRRAPHFREVAALLEPLYLKRSYPRLSVLNRAFIDAVCGYLGICTKISWSWEYRLAEGKTERLVDLCRQAGGTEYISGPTAKGYLDEELFSATGLAVTWFDYSEYQPYPQLCGDFVPDLSVLDLLFNCGPEAPRYLKYAGTS